MDKGESYRARLSFALENILNDPRLGVTVSDLERHLDLSRGYLGQCKPSAPTPRTPKLALVVALEMLSRHPEELDRLRDGAAPR